MIEILFNIGDRVVNMEDDNIIKVGDIGTVIDEDDIPNVLWDRLKEVHCQFQDKLQLIK